MKPRITAQELFINRLNRDFNIDEEASRPMSASKGTQINVNKLKSLKTKIKLQNSAKHYTIKVLNVTRPLEMFTQ